MKLGDDIKLGEQDNVELDPDLAQNKYPDLSAAKSIMAKYLTKEVFEKLKDKKSSTGFTIARAVNSGVRNQAKSLMGCHAGYVMIDGNDYDDGDDDDDGGGDGDDND
jgi:hypothetical protein